jgi:diaminohydroxyphosphoribosylaminopyrimidine deaminase/5-amino-6-(5-phosphoribosylamino)uracil reductase
LLRGLVAEQGVLTVMVEAGGKLSAALFAAGLVDEVVVYLAPLLCGGPVPALGGDGLTPSLALTDLEFTRLGDDVRLRGRVGSRALP